jgi:hypothetical protein
VLPPSLVVGASLVATAVVEPSPVLVPTAPVLPVVAAGSVSDTVVEAEPPVSPPSSAAQARSVHRHAAARETSGAQRRWVVMGGRTLAAAASKRTTWRHQIHHVEGSVARHKNMLRVAARALKVEPLVRVSW